MPNGCPYCCRALEEIEGLAAQIERMTSSYLAGLEKFMTQANPAEREKLVSEHRSAVGSAAGRIRSISRAARDAER